MYIYLDLLLKICTYLRAMEPQRVGSEIRVQHVLAKEAVKGVLLRDKEQSMNFQRLSQAQRLIWNIRGRDLNRRSLKRFMDHHRHGLKRFIDLNVHAAVFRCPIWGEHLTRNLICLSFPLERNRSTAQSLQFVKYQVPDVMETLEDIVSSLSRRSMMHSAADITVFSGMECTRNRLNLRIIKVPMLLEKPKLPIRF